MAEVALNYTDLRAMQSRIAYAKQNVVTQEAMLTLTQQLYDAQLAPEIDLRQAELNVARTKSMMASGTCTSDRRCGRTLAGRITCCHSKPGSGVSE